MTPQQLSERLRLDPETGKIFVTAKGRGRRTGSEAGSNFGRGGYRRIHFDGKTLFAHRVVFALYHGRWPDGPIDHINGDRLDNRVCNLREATHTQNVHNSASRPNASGYRGVCVNKPSGTFTPRIMSHGCSQRLGTFRHPGVAALIYVTAAARLHGEFAFMGGA